MAVNTHAQSYANKKRYLVDSLDLSEVNESDRHLIDSAMTIFHGKANDTTKLNALGAIVEKSWDENVWPKYNQFILDYIAIKEKEYKEYNVGEDVRTHLLENKASAINNKGFYYKGKGDFDKALEYYRKSLVIGKRVNNDEIKAVAYNNIGHIYKTKGKTVEALDYYQKSLKIKRKLGDKSGIATSLNNIGVIYRNVGDISRALNYYFRSLKIIEELDNKRDEAVLRSNIGVMYEEQGDTTSALKFLNQSLVIERQLGDFRGEAISLNHLGSIYSDKKDTATALSFFKKSLKISEKLGDKEGKAFSIFSIGEMYLKNGEPETSLRYFNQSLDIYEAIDVTTGIVSSLNKIAETEFNLGNIQKAKTIGTRGLAEAKELGFPQRIASAAKVLSDVYQKENNWEKAFEMYALHVQMRDSIRNEETEKTAIQQKANYEIGKREEKITVLTTLNEMLERDRKLKELYLRQNSLVGISLSVGILLLLILAIVIYRGLKRQRVINELLEKQKNEVTIKNAEKQAMLKEIHHRVKNNLQIVISLLRFQSREVDDPKIIEMFEDAQNRVITMATIHEKMYSTEDLKNINIREHFTSLIEDLVRGYSVGKNINVDVQVGQVDIGIKTLVPLGLVVNEIVNNSLKHGFDERESGRIHLELKQIKGKRFLMVLGDDGVGFDENSKSGLGTELIEIFVAQLNGSVRQSNENGTEYEIQFEVED